MRDDVVIMSWSWIISGPLLIGTFVTFPAPVWKQSYDHQGDRVQPPSVILQTDLGNLCFCLVFLSQSLRMQYLQSNMFSAVEKLEILKYALKLPHAIL